MQWVQSRFGTCGWPVGSLWVMAALALLPSVAYAGRVGEITIEVDGKQHLSKHTYDNGSPPAAAVWRYLSSTELEPVAGATIPVDPVDPLRATLRGKIVIEVRYGGKAEVAELRLVRRSPEAGWVVDSDDVERMAASIGLRDIPQVPPDTAATAAGMPRGVKDGGEFPVVWVAVGGALLAAGVTIVTVIIRRKRKAGRAEPGAAADPAAR